MVETKNNHFWKALTLMTSGRNKKDANVGVAACALTKRARVEGNMGVPTTPQQA